MQKKVIYSSLVILGLILIGLIFIFWTKAPEKNKICDPYKNIEVIVKNGDLTACDCVKDEVKKIKCQIDIKDAILYNNAIGQTDPSLCSDISKIDLNDACLNLVIGNLEFSKQNGALPATTSNKNN